MKACFIAVNVFKNVITNSSMKCMRIECTLNSYLDQYTFSLLSSNTFMIVFMCVRKSTFGQKAVDVCLMGVLLPHTTVCFYLMAADLR